MTDQPNDAVKRHTMETEKLLNEALAKLAEAEQDHDEIWMEHAQLRKALVYAINHAGGAVDDDTETDFLCMGADQVKAHVERIKSERDRLTAELAKARGLDVMKVVGLCHEIIDAAKCRETRSCGTLLCAEIASKILVELKAPPSDHGAEGEG